MEIIKQSFLSFYGKKVFAVLKVYETAPLLELYTKKVHSATHTPQQVFDLKKSKYVGIKIPRNISETSYEFVIAFENEVVSFGCKRWELMNEWVYCLKTKLRELKVLSPKENLYTRPPAMRAQFMQKTRNPRDDPLPECPNQTDEIPGLERFTQTTASSTLSSSSSSSSAASASANESRTRISTTITAATAISTTTTTAIATTAFIATRTDPVEEAVESASQIESLIESFTASNNVSVNSSEDDSSAAANPISIPIFNFATSNTSSQNLINLLSNPLFRYASNNSDLQFANNFNGEGRAEYNNSFDDDDDYDEEEEDDDDDDVEVNGESEKEIVLPTSVNIEYIAPPPPPPPLANGKENVTIIPVVAETNGCGAAAVALNSGIASKIDESKITKIKIEVDYDHSKSTPTIAQSPRLSTHANNASNKSNDGIKLSNQAAASTSSFTSSASEKKENVKSSAPSTPKKIISPSTPKSTPLHEKRKLSLREQQVLQLRHEINTEIRFKLRKKDCVDALAFATYSGRLWIAGFRPNPQLYVFHIGDQLLAINNIANIRSPADAQKFIKMCAGLFVEITIKRLPLAGIFVIKRDFENQCLGLIRDRSSLLDIVPNSIASRSGIPARPFSASANEDDEEAIFWIITEINFRPLSLISHKKYDETELLLNSVGLETSLLLQPSDFIAKIRKELKAMKNYRDYTLQ